MIAVLIEGVLHWRLEKLLRWARATVLRDSAGPNAYAKGRRCFELVESTSMQFLLHQNVLVWGNSFGAPTHRHGGSSCSRGTAILTGINNVADGVVWHSRRHWGDGRHRCHGRRGSFLGGRLLIRTFEKKLVRLLLGTFWVPCGCYLPFRLHVRLRGVLYCLLYCLWWREGRNCMPREWFCPQCLWHYRWIGEDVCAGWMKLLSEHARWMMNVPRKWALRKFCALMKIK